MPREESPADSPIRLAVIGGGISGLAAAHRLIELSRETPVRRVEVELYEAGPDVGGCFGSERIGDYLIETGADSFVTDKPWCVDLCRRLGLESRIIGVEPACRRALILCRGRPVPTPEGLALLAPRQLAGFWRTPLLSPAAKLRVGMEYFVPARRNGDDESIASFCRRRFGTEFYERIAQPLVGGIYTGDPERLSLAATFPRFQEMERRHGSLIRAARRSAEPQPQQGSGVRYGLFVSLAGGMSELQTALRNRIAESGRIHTGCRVRRIHREQAGDSPHFRLEIDGKDLRSADAIVVALAAPRAAELLGALDAELPAALARIEYASSALVVTGHRRSDVAHPLDAAGLVIPQREHRRILAVSFLSRKFAGRAPADRVVLRTFVGGALQPDLFQLPDAELRVLVQTELRELLGVNGEPEFVRIVRHDRAMPQYTLGHLQRVERIDALAAAQPGLALAGNAYRGVGIPDCIHSGEQAAERVWAHVVAARQSAGRTSPLPLRAD